jgi:site-specific DNA-methyltransferase (adenine-specific)
MTDEVIHSFLAEIERALVPSRYLFLWLDKHALCQATYTTPALQIVDLITWEKSRIGMGYRTRRKCEYLQVRQKPLIVAKATWLDQGIPDVWPERAKGHPHAKPHELQRRLIAATTKPGEVIVDPCAGSFGVMVAAHAAGRQFLGTDLLPTVRYLEAQDRQDDLFAREIAAA